MDGAGDVLGKNQLPYSQEEIQLITNDGIPLPSNRVQQLLSHPLITSTIAKGVGIALTYGALQLAGGHTDQNGNVTCTQLDSSATGWLFFGAGILLAYSVMGHLYNSYATARLEGIEKCLTTTRNPETPQTPNYVETHNLYSATPYKPSARSRVPPQQGTV